MINDRAQIDLFVLDAAMYVLAIFFVLTGLYNLQYEPFALAAVSVALGLTFRYVFNRLPSGKWEKFGRGEADEQ